MATIRNNVLTEGIRGMIGDQLVFRQLRGKTIVSASPSSPRYQSELQKENRRRFRRASAYAKAAMRDPQKKSYYQHKARVLSLPNAYTAALTDYMRRPEAKAVKISKSKRSKGDLVTVNAYKKDFAVASVGVRVWSAQRSIVEHGFATHKDAKKDWLYAFNTVLEKGMIVEVLIKDGAGNIVRCVSDV